MVGGSATGREGKSSPGRFTLRCLAGDGDGDGDGGNSGSLRERRDRRVEHCQWECVDRACSDA
jgi:hypothetical protein